MLTLHQSNSDVDSKHCGDCILELIEIELTTIYILHEHSMYFFVSVQRMPNNQKMYEKVRLICVVEAAL